MRHLVISEAIDRSQSEFKAPLVLGGVPRSMAVDTLTVYYLTQGDSRSRPVQIRQASRPCCRRATILPRWR